jgi:phosphotransferase system IIB component
MSDITHELEAEESLSLMSETTRLKSALAETQKERDELLNLIRKAKGVLRVAQGQFSAVEVPYAPEWTHPLKEAFEILDEAPAQNEVEK